MSNLNQLLFQKEYNGQKLFATRQNLIEDLIANSGTKFHVDKSNTREYVAQFNRLNSYVSLLFNGLRKITPEFKESLLEIAKSKLSINDEEAKEVLNPILMALDSIVPPPSRTPASSLRGDFGIDKLNQMINDQKSAGYVLIVNARPFELYAQPSENIKKVRNELLDSIVQTIVDPSFKKKYRFNFPNKNVAILFWKQLGLHFYKKIETENLQEMLSIRVQQLSEEYVQKDNLNNPAILVYEYLNYLNRSHCLLVFSFQDQPLFTVPYAIYDPYQEPPKSKGYLFVGSSDDNLNIQQIAPFDLINWRNFTWDLIKAKKLGHSELFSESIPRPDSSLAQV